MQQTQTNAPKEVSDSKEKNTPANGDLRQQQGNDNNNDNERNEGADNDEQLNMRNITNQQEQNKIVNQQEALQPDSIREDEDNPEEKSFDKRELPDDNKKPYNDPDADSDVTTQQQKVAKMNKNV